MSQQRGAETFIKMIEHYKHSSEEYPLEESAVDQTMIISCMDKRILPHVFRQLSERSYIFRNGGARITDDVIRSASPAIAEASVNEIILLLHTDCLFNKLTDSEIRHDLHKNLGPCVTEFKHDKPVARECTHSGHNNRDKIHNADYIAFATFKDLRQAVIDGVKRLRESTLISKHVRISGMYYNVETGKIVPVAESPAKP